MADREKEVRLILGDFLRELSLEKADDVIAVITYVKELEKTNEKLQESYFEGRERDIKRERELEHFRTEKAALDVATADLENNIKEYRKINERLTTENSKLKKDLEITESSYRHLAKTITGRINVSTGFKFSYRQPVIAVDALIENCKGSLEAISILRESVDEAIAEKSPIEMVQCVTNILEDTAEVLSMGSLPITTLPYKVKKLKESKELYKRLNNDRKNGLCTIADIVQCEAGDNIVESVRELKNTNKKCVSEIHRLKVEKCKAIDELEKLYREVRDTISEVEDILGMHVSAKGLKEMLTVIRTYHNAQVASENKIDSSSAYRLVYNGLLEIAKMVDTYDDESDSISVNGTVDAVTQLIGFEEDVKCKLRSIIEEL